MHEYAAVAELIENLSRQFAGRGVERIETVRLRRSSAFDDGALRQAFAMLVPGTPLDGAALDVAVEDLDFACDCGHRRVLSADDLIGHLFVCPACGAAREVAHSDDLTVVEVVAQVGAPGARREGGGARCA